MFEFIRSHTKWLQFVLGMVAITFVFWGVGSRMGGPDASREVASVGGHAVNQFEFDQAFRAQQDRMRGMFGKAYDPDKFDTPESRELLVNSLIERRLLLTEAARGNLTVNDGDLRDIILGLPAFVENGKFSRQRFDAYARAQGMNASQFESLLKSDLTARQLTDAIESTAIPSKTALTRWHAINEQEREVSEARFLPAQFLEQAQVTPEQIKEYYAANSKMFEAPQQLAAEYVVLSIDKFAADVPVGETEIQTWYGAHLSQFATPPQRQASHILIAAAKDAPPAERAKARARAEALLAQVKANPANFAALAKQNSQDPGSAAKGGDLGLFTQGMMVKPFNDAAFSMQVGEISPVVESDFGYHIIRLDKIVPPDAKPLSAMHADIERGIKTEKAKKKFADEAETFTNMVYEQSDSLKPVADKYQLQIQRTVPFSRREAASAAPALNNEKLLNALFGDDAVRNRHNTEAVETAPNTLVSARVISSQPARLRALAETEPAIMLILRTKEAAKLARKKAEEVLAELQKGGNPEAKWNPAKIVSRGNPLDLKPDAIDAVFRVDPAKLPGYAIAEGSESAQLLYRVLAVRPPVLADTDKRKKREDQLLATMSREEFDAYLAALRAKTKISINKQNLERKER